jgi:hypothetical protein
MANPACWRCIEGEYLKELIRTKGSSAECSLCRGSNENAFRPNGFGELIEPILSRILRQSTEEHGDPLDLFVQELLSQDLGSDEEIVRAVSAYSPQLDELFFNLSCTNLIV